MGRGLRPSQTRREYDAGAGSPAAAFSSAPESGGAGETVCQGVHIRETGIPEDVDGGDAGLEGPLESAQDLLEATVCPDGHRRTGTVDRLFESGESADRTGIVPAKRDRDPAGSRCQARAN